MSDKVENIKTRIDSIFNPNRTSIEKYYSKYSKRKNPKYIDSILLNNNAIANCLSEKYINNNKDQLEYDMSPEEFLRAEYKGNNFKSNLREAIDNEYFDITFTGTSIVASEGTKYMVINLFTSLLFAILAIAILMAILFRSWRMVLVSLMPNFIPLLFTAGIMGYFGVNFKPSTVLVFSVAFGIAVDFSIHFLTKYKIELKNSSSISAAVASVQKEISTSMIYTAVILFFGFIIFVFSDFGGTIALGLFTAITLFIALLSNLILLPSLLLSYDIAQEKKKS